MAHHLVFGPRDLFSFLESWTGRSCMCACAETGFLHKSWGREAATELVPRVLEHSGPQFLCRNGLKLRDMAYIHTSIYQDLGNHYCKLWAWALVKMFFPTFQVRVVRFYVSCRSPSSPSPRLRPSSPPSSPPSFLVPDLNHEHPRQVFPAGPQPRP